MLSVRFYSSSPIFRELKIRFVAKLLLVLCIILFMYCPIVSANEISYRVESTALFVYRDGLVHVNQALTVNDTFPKFSLRLLSYEIDNVIVVDEKNLILPFEIENFDISVSSLGSSEVIIEYDTVMLTQKENGVWTLILDNSYDLSVNLPEGSTIIYLNEIPVSVSTDDDRTVLQLFTGHWEISYIFPIITGVLPPKQKQFESPLSIL